MELPKHQFHKNHSESHCSIELFNYYTDQWLRTWVYKPQISWAGLFPVSTSPPAPKVILREWLGILGHSRLPEATRAPLQGHPADTVTDSVSTSAVRGALALFHRGVSLGEENSYWTGKGMEGQKWVRMPGYKRCILFHQSGHFVLWQSSHVPGTGSIQTHCTLTQTNNNSTLFTRK